MESEGYCKGETCNRDGCAGIIAEHHLDGGCSCHINPPCSFCETAREYCPVCDWDAREEQLEADKKQSEYWAEYHKRPEVIAERKKQEEQEELFNKMYHGQIPVDKYRARHRSHTNASQIIYGVHPNMTRAEIEKDAKGTFGGRFSKFNHYSFEYIAYTD